VVRLLIEVAALCNPPIGEPARSFLSKTMKNLLLTILLLAGVGAI
jgi:hypothetical protein